MDNSNLKAVVLAAGMGKRMRTEGSDIPKVLRQANGRPLLAYVLEALDFIPPQDIVIVVGYGRELVMQEFPGYIFAVQEQQLGTGHAVQAAMEHLADFKGDLLVCCGDMPLIRGETYSALVDRHRTSENACTMLSGESSYPLPSYGRVVRDSDGLFVKIREARDCSPKELDITELNSGVYVFDAAALRDALGKLRRNNSQEEYYLTDAPKIIRADALKIDAFRRELGVEIIGVNMPEHLKIVEEALSGAVV